MSLLEVLCPILMGVLGFGLVLTVARLIKGPTVPDRVVALDLIAILIVGLLGNYCVWTGRAEFLDLGIAFGLVVFLGTVAFARYLEKGAS